MWIHWKVLLDRVYHDLSLSHLGFKGSDLGKVAWCYMWQFPPGTSRLLILALETHWRVSSVGKGLTPVVGTRVPLWAPPAPLWAETIHVTLHSEHNLLLPASILNNTTKSKLEVSLRDKGKKQVTIWMRANSNDSSYSALFWHEGKSNMKSA